MSILNIKLLKLQDIYVKISVYLWHKNKINFNYERMLNIFLLIKFYANLKIVCNLLARVNTLIFNITAFISTRILLYKFTTHVLTGT